MRNMGIPVTFYENQNCGEAVYKDAENEENTTRDINAGNSQFSFPDMQTNSADSKQRQQIFSTSQWRPKEPPSYAGNASGDVHLWTTLAQQHFVFMNGTPKQKVAFAVTLLRGAAHELYLGYERRNGNKPPLNWPTLKQTIPERFGFNILAQEEQSKLMVIWQGKHSVHEYTSELETLHGRPNSQDGRTWLNVYTWGLQPHLASAVALK